MACKSGTGCQPDEDSLPRPFNLVIVSGSRRIAATVAFSREQSPEEGRQAISGAARVGQGSLSKEAFLAQVPKTSE